MASWLTGWSFRKEITVQDTNIDGNETDFPVLVELTADEDIGDESRGDGYDIRFTQSDGETLLKYEREYWTGGVGADATAVFWVKSNLASSGGATIYIYYGKADASDGEDPPNVWDGNFVAVYHMSESSNPYIDSTGNNDSNAGTYPDQDDGKVYKGQNFDDDNDEYISIPDSATLDIAANVTMSAWVKWTGGTDNDNTVIGKVGNYILRTINGDGSLQVLYWHSTNVRAQPTSTYNLTDGAWTYLSFTHILDFTSQYYINGATAQTTYAGTVDAVDLTNALHIGGYGLGVDRWEGVIDEIRISSMARAVSWIKFEYYNMNEADNELTFGGEEVSGYTLALDAGSYVLTGSIMSPLFGRLISIDSGTYALTGSAASLLRDALLGIGSGSFALTGKNLSLIHNKLISIEAGIISLTGSDVTLTLTEISIIQEIILASKIETTKTLASKIAVNKALNSLIEASVEFDSPMPEE